MRDLNLFAVQRKPWSVKRRALMRRLPPLLASLVIIATGCGGAKHEAGRGEELPYAVLDKALQPLRRDFEDADGKVRLVGVVTPTCGDCIEMATDIDERLLPAIAAQDFVVFLVWTCHVPPDVEPGARRCAEKFANPRIRHYWDGSGKVARAFGRHAGLLEGADAYGLFYLYGRTDTWDPQGKMADEPPDYNAALAGWQPADPRARAGRHPHLTLPQFNVETLRPQIEQLLAEPDPRGGGDTH
jgi:hypothetical protein